MEASRGGADGEGGEGCGGRRGGGGRDGGSERTDEPRVGRRGAQAGASLAADLGAFLISPFGPREATDTTDRARCAQHREIYTSLRDLFARQAALGGDNVDKLQKRVETNLNKVRALSSPLPPSSLSSTPLTSAPAPHPAAQPPPLAHPPPANLRRRRRQALVAPGSRPARHRRGAPEAELYPVVRVGGGPLGVEEQCVSLSLMLSPRGPRTDRTPPQNSEPHQPHPARLRLARDVVRAQARTAVGRARRGARARRGVAGSA